MGIITKMCRQTAVYWPPCSSDGETDNYGQPLYEHPIEIKCRWEDQAELHRDAQGREFTSRSLVYVLHDCKPGGLLMLGTLDSVTEYAKPAQQPGAYEIRSFNRTPNLRATETLREAIL